MSDLYLYPQTNSNPRPIPHVWKHTSNYHNAGEDRWTQDGFVKYINEVPSYDPETHVAVKTNIVDGVQHYEIREKPPLPVPQALSPLRFFMAVHQVLGYTESQIKVTIEDIEDDTERESALTTFNRAQTFRRDNSLLQSLKESFNITDEQLDDLFRYAETLEV
ncbi:MAG: hypothetical protein LAT55_13615 [Opitutales bacterium]|nr:hypothetical protein [Opitutales bacterium]